MRQTDKTGARSVPIADIKNQALAIVEHLRMSKRLTSKQQDCCRNGQVRAKAEV